MQRSFWIAVVLGIILAFAGVAVCSAQSIDLTTTAGVNLFVHQQVIDWAAAWIADVYLAKPTYVMPDLRGIATDRDFSVSMTGPVVVSVSDKLKYNLSMGPWLFKGDVPHIDPWVVAKAAGIGFLVGVAATITVEALTGHLK